VICALVCCSSYFYRSALFYFFVVMASFTKLKASSGLVFAPLPDSKNEKPLAAADEGGEGGE
jgi:hypothetical protein